MWAPILLLSLSLAWGGQSLITQQNPEQALPAKIDPRNHYLLPPTTTNQTGKHFAALAAVAPQATSSTGALICGPGNPCIDGSCCGPNNICGYGSDYCGSGCQSNCSATSTCGRDSAGGDVSCGMNTCCSYYGWCGVTADYCTPGNDGCQQGFGACQVYQPFQCSGSSATARTIGYYQGGNVIPGSRACQQVTPSMINTAKYTHLYWAFAEIDPGSFQVTPGEGGDTSLYSGFTALKSPGKLETWIGVGGFDFTTANPTTWSQMVSTAANRQTFITSLVSFMNQYGFQGVDLDWEYPVDQARGGSPDDMVNLVQLLADMRAHAGFGHNFGISVTLAPDLWYLQHFDAKGLLNNADWLGFMSYDLHGIWDADVANLGKVVYGQTDIHDIERDLTPLWFDLTADLMSRVNFGLALYGRGYTLADPACNRADGTCAWTAGSNPGPCTATTGVLSLVEIENIISTKGLTPVALDDGQGDSMMKQITWDDQWIGYDDNDTYAAKTAYASSHCFGGTMSWSVDLAVGSLDTSGSDPPPPPSRRPSDDCSFGACGSIPGVCPTGQAPLTWRSVDPEECNPDFFTPGAKESYCCPSDTLLDECVWRGTPPDPCDEPNPLDCPGCSDNLCLDGEDLVLFDELGDKGVSCNVGSTKVSKGYALCCTVKGQDEPWYETAFQGIWWADAQETCTTDQLNILVEATRMADEMVNAFNRKTPDQQSGSSAFNRYFYGTSLWADEGYFDSLAKIYSNINSTATFPKGGKKNSKGVSGRAQKVSYYCQPPAGLPGNCVNRPPGVPPDQPWSPAATTYNPRWDDLGWSVLFCPKFFTSLRYLNDITKTTSYRWTDIAGMNSFEYAIAHEWMHVGAFGYPELIVDLVDTVGFNGANVTIYGDKYDHLYAWKFENDGEVPNVQTRLNADTYALMFEYDWYHDVLGWTGDDDGAWAPQKKKRSFWRSLIDRLTN